MTRDPRLTSGAAPLDDAAIGELVRDVAEGWTMPPVRLDAPAWRERVRDPRARRLAAARGWLTRMGRAATAAVALTVAGALVAVVLTAPPDDPGKSPGTTDGATPVATDAALATPLPKLLATGDLPVPSEVVVLTEQGDVALVDLASGSIGRPLTGARFGSLIQVRADGTLVCLCLAESGSVGGSPTNAALTLDRFDAAGALLSTTPIESFTGAPDPRDEGRFIPDQPAHVLTATSFSDGGRYGLVGWSLRAHPAWRSGLLVVDLQSGEVVSRVDLPDGFTGDDDSRRVHGAPRVVGSTGADGLVVARPWYEFTPPDSVSARYRFDTEAYRVGFVGGALAAPTAIPAATGCGSEVDLGGALPDGGTWLACSSGGGGFLTVVRRISADGSSLPDIRVPGSVGIEGDTLAPSRDGRTLFVWDPGSTTLTRIELATGATTTGQGLTADAGDGPLVALGQWLAPSTAAKTFLRSSVIVSPDGTRVYAIGVREGLENPGISGSAGVFVFDATTLEPIAVYPPTADFVSIAVSADGRFVYAAGLPGVDALGRRRGDQGASITVFDTADGGTRLIAGQLGPEMISFGPDPLD